MAKAKRVGNNPHVTEAMYGSTAAAFGESGMYFEEYRYADSQPKKTCEKCGNDAWMKPTVGAYVCSHGHVKTQRGWF